MIGCGKILCTLCNCYPMCICAADYAFGGVGLCTYHVCKKQLFSALPLENLLLSVFYYFFTEFKCLVCYVQ